MIHAIKIQNYQSIRDEAILDFTVAKQAPDHQRYLNGVVSDVRIAAIQSFIGANGSGKTTGLKALAFVGWLITSSFRFNDRDRRIPVNQFAGYGKKTKPTLLEVTFELKKDLHIYKVSVTSERILSEELYVRTKSERKITSKRLFQRSWNKSLGRYDISDSGFGIGESFWCSGDLGKSSIIAVSKRFGNEYAAKIVACWERVETNITIEDHYRNYEFSQWFAMDYYKSHPKMRTLAEHDIKRYDLGIASFGKDGTFVHKYGNDSFTLTLDQESSGTRQLLVIKKMIEGVLVNGGVAVIDEPDSFLHPLMLKSLVTRFSDKNINKGKGQLIFSTHDIYVLDFLEKYEINLVDKHKNEGVTRVRRLDTIPGVRNTDNFVKKYFEGEYGGLPTFE
jgi:uncharacterized protein